MPQDQLFKALIQEFFREFMELFYPEVAARLDFNTVSFLDKELFTDLPEGVRREADLVAQVQTKTGEPELILVHTEIQTKRTGEMAGRMWEYYALLRLRRKLPVFPNVVYLSPGAGGIVTETYEESLWETPILTFRISGRRFAGFEGKRLPYATRPAIACPFRLDAFARYAPRGQTLENHRAKGDTTRKRGASGTAFGGY